MFYPFIEHVDDPDLNLVFPCGEFCDRLEAYLEEYFYAKHADEEPVVRGLVRQLRGRMAGQVTHRPGVDHVLFFTNRAGQTMAWRRHSTDHVQTMINEMTTNDDPLAQMIGEVARVAGSVTEVEEVGVTVTDPAGHTVGHIHIQTTDHIIEVSLSAGEVDDTQLARLTDHESAEYLNYFNKKAIYYVANIFNGDQTSQDTIETIRRTGVPVVNSPDTLRRALKP
jgi:hypothetical protein